VSGHGLQVTPVFTTHQGVPCESALELGWRQFKKIDQLIAAGTGID